MLCDIRSVLSHTRFVPSPIPVRGLAVTVPNAKTYLIHSEYGFPSRLSSFPLSSPHEYLRVVRHESSLFRPASFNSLASRVRLHSIPFKPHSFLLSPFVGTQATACGFEPGRFSNLFSVATHKTVLHCPVILIIFFQGRRVPLSAVPSLRRSGNSVAAY